MQLTKSTWLTLDASCSDNGDSEKMAVVAQEHQPPRLRGGMCQSMQLTIMNVNRSNSGPVHQNSNHDSFAGNMYLSGPLY
jgi:hypothetical protein